MELKKNKKYDLEPKRPLFFGVGMIIALSLTIVAFEWKSPIDPVVQPNDPEIEIWYVLDDPKITKHKPIEIPKPKVNKQVITAAAEIKEVKELTEALNDNKTVNDIDDELDKLDFGEPKTIDIPDDPFIVVEDMPEFPGGDAALLGFIAKNIKYPRQAKRMGVEGKVHISFVVDIDGSISDIKILKGIGAGCDEEAIRVLKLLPAFSPGKQRGVPVKVQMQLPVNFQLR
ncbi:energy transducer TonB [Ekhidna sp.]